VINPLPHRLVFSLMVYGQRLDVKNIDSKNKKCISYGKNKKYTIKRRVYLYVCTFAPSSVLLTNRLMHALTICINCSLNLSWSSKQIFNFLRFVIQKFRVL